MLEALIHRAPALSGRRRCRLGCALTLATLALALTAATAAASATATTAAIAAAATWAAATLRTTAITAFAGLGLSQALFRDRKGNGACRNFTQDLVAPAIDRRNGLARGALNIP